MARSERELIRDCVESGRLHEGTETAFREWLDKLESGAWKELSHRQRQWLDDMCERLGIDPGAENLVSSGAMKVTPRERAELKKFVDSLGPRPTKPPGKR